MDQNTESWLKFRGNSIGASEIAVVMGISPYKKRAVLLKEKAFPYPKDDNRKDDKDFIYQKGHNYEKKIRNFVEFDTGLEFPTQPTVIFENPNYSTPIHASLDGITPASDIIIECKYVGYDSFDEYKRTQTPPPHYMVQIQQQLLITGARKAIFAFCRELKTDGVLTGLEYAYFDVLPDEAIQHDILVEAKKFWDEVIALRESGPQDHTELDELVASYEHNLRACELLEASQAVLKEKIFNLVGKDVVKRHNYTVQTVVSKGAIKRDYAAYFEDNKIELPEKYITVGKGSTSQRITFAKVKAE